MADAVGGARMAGAGGGSGGADARPPKRGRLGDCRVCCKAEAKYKCPRCKTPYCTLACSRRHGESCDPSGGAGAGADGVGGADSGARRRGAAAGHRDPGAEEEEEEDDDSNQVVVTEEQLARLRNSASIRAALRDPKLQELVRAVDAGALPHPRQRPRTGEASTALRGKALDRARVAALDRLKASDSEFRKFVDNVLTTVGACEVDADGNTVFVA